MPKGVDTRSRPQSRPLSCMRFLWVRALRKLFEHLGAPLIPRQLRDIHDEQITHLLFRLLRSFSTCGEVESAALRRIEPRAKAPVGFDQCIDLDPFNRRSFGHA